MTKKILFLLLSTALSIPDIFANTPDWVWAKSTGGNADDQGKSVVIDAFGNSYVTGFFFSSSISFGSITLINDSSGQGDIFIAKYDPNGNVIWAKRAGGKITDRSLSVAVAPNGNCFIAGYFGSDSISFDNITLINVNSSTIDMFVAAFDSSGNAIWARGAGGAGSEVAYSVAVDSSSNCYVTGYFGDTISFDTTTLTSAGSSDIFVTKYNSSGQVIWAAGIGGSSAEYGTGIAVDAKGNSYVTGYFRSTTLAFGSTVLLNAGPGYDDLFVAKYDSSGHAAWAQRAGGSYYEKANGIAVDANGNSYITGKFGSSLISFGNITLQNTGMATKYDLYVAKYDSSGNALWAINAQGDDDDESYGIALDAAGNCYITGYFTSDSIAFGNIELHPQQFNFPIFVAKYSSSGNIVWATCTNGDLVDWGEGIASDASGNICVTGFFSSSSIILGNDTLINSGSNTVFVARASCVSYGTVNITACDTFYSPSGNYSWITSGNYSDTLVNITGCDSILLIQLTINNTSFSTINIAACNSYISPDGLHTWTSNGTYYDTILNATGCDSIITINLSVTAFDTTVSRHGNILSANDTAATYQWLDCSNGFAVLTGDTNALFTGIPGNRYAVIITRNGCSDTTACYPVCSAYFTLYQDTIPHNWIAVNSSSGAPPATFTWNWGDSTTSMGAAPAHVYSDSAYYNICLTVTDNNGCTDTYCDSSTYIHRHTSGSAMIIITVIDSSGLHMLVPNPESDNSLLLYPNPAVREFRIRDEENSIEDIRLTDVTGRKILSPRFIKENKEVTVDLGNVARGVYWVRVLKSKEKVYNKIIVIE